MVANWKTGPVFVCGPVFVWVTSELNSDQMLLQTAGPKDEKYTNVVAQVQYNSESPTYMTIETFSQNNTIAVRKVSVSLSICICVSISIS